MEAEPSTVEVVERELELNETDVSQYEFNEHQNEIIHDMSKKMRRVSWALRLIAIPVSILYILQQLPDFQEQGLYISFDVIQIIVYIVISRWIAKMASSFKLIVQTESNDLENLMMALGEMRKLYRLQRGILEITLAFLVIRPVLELILHKLNLPTGGL